eukprot:m.183312 g.183312  ORF g.183312 m.183312 type:complete len:5791 (+) comp10000_c0_seq6:916-18288(+)
MWERPGKAAAKLLYSSSQPSRDTLIPILQAVHAGIEQPVNKADISWDGAVHLMRTITAVQATLHPANLHDDSSFKRIRNAMLDFDDQCARRSSEASQYAIARALHFFINLLTPEFGELHGHTICFLIFESFPALAWLYLSLIELVRRRANTPEMWRLAALAEDRFSAVLQEYQLSWPQITHYPDRPPLFDRLRITGSTCKDALITALETVLSEMQHDHQLMPCTDSVVRLRMNALWAQLRIALTSNSQRAHAAWNKLVSYGLLVSPLVGYESPLLQSLRPDPRWPCLHPTRPEWAFYEFTLVACELHQLPSAEMGYALWQALGTPVYAAEDRGLEIGNAVSTRCAALPPQSRLTELWAWTELLAVSIFVRMDSYGAGVFFKAMSGRISKLGDTDPDSLSGLMESARQRGDAAGMTLATSITDAILAGLDTVESVLRLPPHLLTRAAMEHCFKFWQREAPRNSREFALFLETIVLQFSQLCDPPHRAWALLYGQRIWVQYVASQVHGYYLISSRYDTLTHLAFTWPLMSPALTGSGVDAMRDDAFQAQVQSTMAGLQISDQRNRYEVVRAAIKQTNIHELERNYLHATHETALPEAYLYVCDVVANAILPRPNNRGIDFVVMDACRLLKSDFPVEGPNALRGGYLVLSLYARTLSLLQNISEHALGIRDVDVVMNIASALRPVVNMYGNRLQDYEATAKALVAPLEELIARLIDGRFTADELFLDRAKILKKFDMAAQLQRERLAPPDIDHLLHLHEQERHAVLKVAQVYHALDGYRIGMLRLRRPPPDLLQDDAGLRRLALADLSAQLHQYRVNVLEGLTDEEISCIHHFTTRQSKLFRSFFSKFFIKYHTIKAALKATIDSFQRLCKPVLPIAELTELYTAVRDSKAGFGPESVIISLWFKTQLNEDTFRNFRSAMALLQLGQELRSVPRFLAQFQLFPDVAQALVEVCNIERDVIRLETAQQELEKLQRRAYNLQPWMAEYLGALVEAQELLQFIVHQTDFIGSLGMVMDNVQGDEIALGLMNQLQRVFDGARPVIDVIRNPTLSSFPNFVDAMAALVRPGDDRQEAEANIVKQVRPASDLSTKMVEIRANFGRTTAESVETMIPLIRSYLNDGKFISHLARSDEGEGLIFLCVKSVQGGEQVSMIKDIVLRDFVHGLSLYENRTEAVHSEDLAGGSALDVFCRLYTVLMRVHELRIELEGAGHPDFFVGDAKKEFKLKFSHQLVKDFEKEEIALRQSEERWSRAVAAAQQEHPRMLFLAPKLLSTLLYRMRDDRNPTTIAPYVRECFPDYAFADGGRSAATDARVAAVLAKLEPHGPGQDHAAQLEAVGELLDGVEAVLEGTGLPVLTVESAMPMVCIFPTATPELLLQFARELCGGEELSPSVLVIDCSLTPLSRSHFEMILKRPMEFSSLPCVMLHAEKLSADHRAILLKWLSDLHERDQLEGRVRPGPITFVFTDKAGADVFVEFNRMQRDSTYVDQAGITKRARELMQAHKVQPFVYLCNSAGTGKTFYIDEQLRQLPAQTTCTMRVAVNEDFSPTAVAKRLQNEDFTGKNLLGLHINASAYCNYALLESFLYELILFGRICDQSTGFLFQLPESLSCVIYIELTFAPADEEAHKQFSTRKGILDALPLVDLLGTSQDNISLPVAHADPDAIARCYAWIRERLSHSLNHESLVGLLAGDIKCTPAEVLALRERLFDFAEMYDLLKANIALPKGSEAVLSGATRASDLALAEAVLCRAVDFLRRYYETVLKFGSMGGNTPSSWLAAFSHGIPEPTQLLERFIYEAWYVASRPLSARVSNFPLTLSVRDLGGDGTPAGIELINFCTIQNKVVRFRDNFAVLSYAEACANPARVRIVLGPLMSIQNTAIIPELLRQINYILTPDGLVKNVLLCERRRAGLNAVIVGDTGTGKTMLLRLQSLLMNADSNLFPARVPAFKTFLETTLLDVITPHIPSDVRAMMVSLLHRRKENTRSGPQMDTAADMHVVFDYVMTQCDSDDPNAPVYVAPEPAGPVAAAAPRPAGPGAGPAGSPPVEAPRNPISRGKLFETVRRTVLDYFAIFFRSYPLIIQSPAMEVVVRRRRANPPANPNPDQLLDDSDPLLPQSIDQLLLLVSEFFTAKTSSLFCELMMSPRITHSALREHVAGVRACAERVAAVAREMKLPVVPTVLSFIDEFNTTPNLMGAIKEIFCDGSLDGQPLPKNIFWVAAMNPKGNMAAHAPGQSHDYTGVAQPRSDDDFIVRPEPVGMKRLQINFGELDQDQEETFIRNSVEFDPPTPGAAFFEAIVSACQNFVRKAKLKRMHVSLRDVIRVRKLHAFFASDTREPSRQRGRRLLQLSEYRDRHGFDEWMPFIMSMALCYYLRLPKEGEYTRARFAAEMDRLLIDSRNEAEAARVTLHGHEDPRRPFYPQDLEDIGFERLVYSCFEGLFNETKVPEGTARTRTIMENVFTIVACVMAPVPLLIVGPAGCSKTLSFTIVADNMRGADAYNEFYKGIPMLRSSRYQCSEQSTDAEIRTVFENAMNGQKHNAQVIYVVFMDEAGLTPEHEMPLKAIHYELDCGVVASVLLSNKVLDAAKTNRTLQMVHDRPSEDDSRKLALACLFNLRPQPSANETAIADALCRGFKELVRRADNSSFEQRDFIYFLRYVRDKLRGHPEDTIKDKPAMGKMIAASLLRNFNGLEHSVFTSRVAANFCHGMRQVDDDLGMHVELALMDMADATVANIRECLSDELHEGDDPNVSAIRNVMIIDPTPSGSAVALMLELGLIDKAKYKVIHVEAFARDREPRARGDVVAEVKGAMAKGETIVLLNSLNIQSSFYDVFNRHFRSVVRTDEHGKETTTYLANVAMGSLSRLCKVHKDFRVIVVFPESKLHEVPLPLRSRFAKFRLSCKHLLSDRLQKRIVNNQYQETYPVLGAEQDSMLDLLGKSVDMMVDELHRDECKGMLLHGLVPVETVTSLKLRINEATSNPIMITVPLALHSPREDDAELQAEIMDFSNVAPLSAEGLATDLASHKRFAELVRLANFLLMQFARPERLFACRKMPPAYLREVILNQEHFSLCRFVRALKLALSTPQRPVNVARKWVVFSRSCAAYQRVGKVPSELYDQVDGPALPAADKNDPLLSHLVGADHLQRAACIQLASVPSGRKCGLIIDAFFADKAKDTLILIADTAHCTAAGIQCARYHVDRAEEAYLAGRDILDAGLKTVLVVLHSPPEQSFESFCNAIYLRDWDFACVDSFGVDLSPGADANDAASFVEDNDVRTWILKACGETTLQVPAQTLHKAFGQVLDSLVARNLNALRGVKFLPADIQLTQELFRPAPPGQQVPVGERLRILKKLLANTSMSFMETLLQRFVKSWKAHILQDLFRNVCNDIMSGHAVGSIELSLRIHLGHLLEPMVVEYLNKILRDYAIERIIAELHAEGERKDAMVMYVKQAVDSIRLPKISAVFSGVMPVLSGLRLTTAGTVTPPRLPMFRDVMDRMKDIAAKLLSSAAVGKRDVALVLSMSEQVAAHDKALFQMVSLVGAEPSLRVMFLRDFIRYECNLEKLSPVWIGPLVQAIEGHLQSATPLSQGIFGFIATARESSPAALVCAVSLFGPAVAQQLYQFAAATLPLSQLADRNREAVKAAAAAAGTVPELLNLTTDVFGEKITQDLCDLASRAFVDPPGSLDERCTKLTIKVLYRLAADCLKQDDDDNAKAWIEAARLAVNRIGSLTRLLLREDSVYEYFAVAVLYYARRYLPFFQLRREDDHPAIVGFRVATNLMNACITSVPRGAFNPDVVCSFTSAVVLKILLGSERIDSQRLEMLALELGEVLTENSPCWRPLSDSFKVQVLLALFESVENSRDATMLDVATAFMRLSNTASFAPPAVYPSEVILNHQNCAPEAVEALRPLIAGPPQPVAAGFSVSVCLYYALVHMYGKKLDLSATHEQFTFLDRQASEAHKEVSRNIARAAARAACALQLLKRAAEKLSTDFGEDTQLDTVLPCVASVASIIQRSSQSGAVPLVPNAAVVLLSSIRDLSVVQQLLSVRANLDRLSLDPAWSVQVDGAVLRAPPVHRFQFCLPGVEIDHTLWEPAQAQVLRRLQEIYRECEPLVAGTEAALVTRLNAIRAAGDSEILRYRACLLLAMYYTCFEQGRPCAALQSTRDPHSTVAALLGMAREPAICEAFAFIANGPLDVPDNTDSARRLFSRQARQPQARQQNSRANLAYAGLMVSCLAVAVGSPPSTNHIQARLFEHARLNGSACAGSDYGREQRDCGFKYEPGTLLTTGCNPPIMGNNMRYRLALNTMTWMPMTFSMVINPANIASLQQHVPLMFTYHEDAQLDPRAGRQRTAAQCVMEFSHVRAFGYLLGLEAMPQSVADGLDAVQFVNESLLRLFLMCDRAGHSPADRPAALQSIFPRADDAFKYENLLQERVFNEVNRQIVNLRRPYEAIGLRQCVQQEAMLKSIQCVRQRRLHSRLGDGLVPPVEVLDEYLATKLQQLDEIIAEDQPDNADGGWLRPTIFVRHLREDGAFAVAHVVVQGLHFLSRLQRALHLRLTKEEALTLTVSKALAKLHTLGDLASADIWKLFDGLKRVWETLRVRLEHTDLCPALRNQQRQGQNIQHEVAVMTLRDETLLIDVIDDGPEDTAFMRVLKALLGVQQKFVGAVRTICGHRYINPSELFIPATSIVSDTSVAAGLFLDGRNVWAVARQHALASVRFETDNTGSYVSDFDVELLWDRIAEFAYEKEMALVPRAVFKFRSSTGGDNASLLQSAAAPTPPQPAASVVKSLQEYVKTLRPDLNGKLSDADRSLVQGQLQTCRPEDLTTAISLMVNLLRALARAAAPAGDDGTDGEQELQEVCVSPEDTIELALTKMLQVSALPVVLHKLRKLRIAALGEICSRLATDTSEERTNLYQSMPTVLHQPIPPSLQDHIRKSLERFEMNPPIPQADVLELAQKLVDFFSQESIATSAQCSLRLPLFVEIRRQIRQLPPVHSELLESILQDQHNKVLCNNLRAVRVILYNWHAHIRKPRHAEAATVPAAPPVPAAAPAAAAAGVPDPEVRASAILPVAKYVEFVPAFLVQLQQPMPQDEPAPQQEALGDEEFVAAQPEEAVPFIALAEPAPADAPEQPNTFMEPWQPAEAKAVLSDTLPPAHLATLAVAVSASLTSDERSLLADQLGEPESSDKYEKIARTFAQLCLHLCRDITIDFAVTCEQLCRYLAALQEFPQINPVPQYPIFDFDTLLFMMATLSPIGGLLWSPQEVQYRLAMCECGCPPRINIDHCIVGQLDVVDAEYNPYDTTLAEYLSSAITSGVNRGMANCESCNRRLPYTMQLAAPQSRFSIALQRLIPEGVDFFEFDSPVRVPRDPFRLGDETYEVSTVISYLDGRYHASVRTSETGAWWHSHPRLDHDTSLLDQYAVFASFRRLERLDAEAAAAIPADLPSGAIRRTVRVQLDEQSHQLVVVLLSVETVLDDLRASIEEQLNFAGLLVESVHAYDANIGDTIELVDSPEEIFRWCDDILDVVVSGTALLRGQVLCDGSWQPVSAPTVPSLRERIHELTGLPCLVDDTGDVGPCDLRYEDHNISETLAVSDDVHDAMMELSEQGKLELFSFLPVKFSYPGGEVEEDLRGVCTLDYLYNRLMSHVGRDLAPGDTAAWKVYSSADDEYIDMISLEDLFYRVAADGIASIQLVITRAPPPPPKPVCVTVSVRTDVKAAAIAFDIEKTTVEELFACVREHLAAKNYDIDDVPLQFMKKPEGKDVQLRDDIPADATLAEVALVAERTGKNLPLLRVWAPCKKKKAA